MSSKEYNAQYRKNNRERIRAYDIDRLHLLRQKAIDVLGGKCVHCGIADVRVLQIDHINGGGTKENRAISSHGIEAKVVRTGGEGYQLLCANCNWIKRSEKKEVRGHTLS